jgi:peptidoglycan hydrolase-like protein with peptidoglycan-binding domain
VFAHTYDYNRIYERSIFPLGQIYSSPPSRQIIRFRQLSRAYGAGGVSWWDWQEATPSSWTALSRPAGPLAGYATDSALASIGLGSTGDLVVWAQEHLISAGFPIAVSGDFGSHTQQAVQAFQSAHGLTADGVVGTATWTALLRYRTARITWTTRHGARMTMAGRAGSRGTRLAPVPQSATIPARRDEIAGAGGAGGHPGP